MSSVHIVEEHDIEIHAPKFAVDGVLHEQIPSPLPKASHSMAFIGPPGSGKSSLATAMLTQTHPKIYNGVFDVVVLFQPEASFLSMRDNPFKDHPRVMHELTNEILIALESAIEKNSKAKQNTLVIIDDFAAELKDHSLQRKLLRFVNNRRHLRMSLWIITQTFRSIPLAIRKCIGNWVLFKPSNKREIESLAEEIGMSRHDFGEYMDFVFPPGAPKHEFLFIDELAQPHKKFSRIST